MSGLPMIKCSSCGVDIDILQLADHVCAPSNKPATTSEERGPPTPPKPARSFSPTSPPKLQRAPTFGSVSFSNRSDGQAPSGRMRAPPRIDSNAANKPFVSLEPSIAGNHNDQRDRSQPSPAPPKSPYLPIRSATTPVPAPRRKLAPPSPKLSSNMDCAFPRFPRSATPQSTKPPSQERQDYVPREQYAQPSPMFAPLSPMINGGENITKRMDRIAPGPFDGRSDRSPSVASIKQNEDPVHVHRRTNTQGSWRSLGSMTKQRTSVASNISHGSSYSTRSIGLPARPKPRPDDNNAPLPPNPNASRADEGIDAFLSRLRQDAGSSNHARQGSQDRKQPPARPRRPSEKDLPPNDMHEIQPSTENSFSSTSPSRSLQPPPLMPPTFRNDTSLNSLHTPSDSGLSDDSYASSGFRSAASSRSSPPGSEAGHSREASKISPADYLGETMQRTTSPDSYLGTQSTPPRDGASRGYGNNSRLNPPQPASRSFSPDFENAPESPMDPAIQMGTAFNRRPGQPLPRQDPALDIVRAPSKHTPGSETRRQDSRPSKGKCRGCSEPIIGKSVKDSSGRLTGRYHKQCFVCRTCNDSFPTAEFYVFENSPYCERHYHELNRSLCTSCDRGIEGQYLETDDHLKFHPRCLSCSTCRVVLRDDYFEVAGKKYCERHAQHAAAPSQNFLGPGSYRPRMEKRRTRLMMMA